MKRSCAAKSGDSVIPTQMHRSNNAQSAADIRFAKCIPSREIVGVKKSHDRESWHLSAPAFAARFADRVTARTLKPGTNFNQFAATDRANGARRLLFARLLFLVPRCPHGRIVRSTAYPVK